MKKGTRNIMMAAGLGALFWYFIRKGKRPPAAEQAVALKAALPLPTDTMAAGTVGPAAQGIVKDGATLSCIGCGCYGGC